ncbi:lectin OAA family protein [Sphingomonas hylomeconis]|uniref:Lectin ESA-2 n=1 Tax=Sphingomonas hylomeconis TaxID=1395958 RepID=A0ABV7SUP6_9SPHN|nr:lectin ESA-2 [Sphingomonas hylomeconis]
MTVYNTQNQWGGSSAPWNDGGVLSIGNRADQQPIALSIRSDDGGQTFTVTMTYQGEGPIGFRGTLTTTHTYQVENQWGGDAAPWNDAGLFLLGARADQKPIAFELASNDGGQTLRGTMTYDGEGPIGVQGTLSEGVAFVAANQWGGSSAPWNPGGLWVIGCRANQPVVALDVTSDDQGNTLNGWMTYFGEGPIGFRGKRTMADTYAVENQWGGDSAPWNLGGTWVLGCRPDQGVVAINVNNAGGNGLSGTMTYTGEGPIGLELVPGTVKALSHA